MKPLNIAVISDLHIGNKARAKDFRVNEKQKAIDDNYKENFIKFIKKKTIKSDYLVIPGDITNSGNPNEALLASNIISEIADSLFINKEKIIFVPGNHDVDWEVLKLDRDDKTGVRRKQRYAAFQNKDCIFESIVSRAKKQLLKNPDFSVWELGELIAVGFNSAGHDSPYELIHHGLAKNESIKELDELLSTIDLQTFDLRLFIIHHHPIQYSNPIPNVPDFSIITNNEELLNLLQKYKFDLIIHGHKHNPRFRTISINSGFPLNILCSGSFSAEIDIRWSGIINNQFHLVKIHGRDKRTECIYGMVKSWTYICSDYWIQSQKHNGIQHKTPFGANFYPSQLKKDFLKIFKDNILKKGFIEWEDIISINKNYGYLPSDRIAEIIKSITNELNLHCSGDLPYGAVIISKEKLDEIKKKSI